MRRDEDDLEGEDVDDPQPSTSGSGSEPRPRPRVETTATPVWSYYIKTTDGFGAKCRSCSKIIKIKSGSTTSLHRHLKLHSSEYAKFEKAQLHVVNERKNKQSRIQGLGLGLPVVKQQTITQCLNKQNKWPADHPRAVSITNCIADWMTTNMHPFSIVDEPKFKAMLQSAEPHYNVPCRTTFSRTLIPQLYVKTKHEIESLLNKALASGKLESISITCDMWTSKSNQSYIGVTCHFIDCEDFQIKSYCLGNIHFPENHTGMEIAEKLTSLLGQWKLAGGTIPIYAVTDNARNMVFGISHTSFIHVSCFAHSLQLTISDAIKKTDGVDKMLSIARALVGHFKRSAQATTRLLLLQERLGETKHALIQDCPTRWNSQYLMLERLVEHKESISAVSADDDGITCLSAHQWIMASAYVELLQPFDEATTTVSSETTPTLSAVIPIVHGLESFLTDYINKNLSGKGFARSLLQSLKSRFPYYLRVENNIKMLAMIIDPRYKTTILPKCDHQRASALMMSEVKNMSAPRPNPTAIAHSDQGLQTEANAVSGSKSSLWSAFALQTERQKILANDDQLEIAYEIKQFLNLPVVNEHPCVWWNSNSSKFPHLAKAARKFLSIPATEVASERVFSAAGNIISERRQSLIHEHVEQLVFLQQNSRH